MSLACANEASEASEATSDDDDDDSDSRDDEDSELGDDDDDSASQDDDDDNASDSDDDDDDASDSDDDDDDASDSDDDDDDDDDDDSSTSGGDDDDDETTQDTSEEDPLGIYVTPNLDDDNGDGSADFDDGYFAADDDVVEYALDFLTSDTAYTVEVSGQSDDLKLFVDGKGWMQSDGSVESSFDFSTTGSALSLQVTMGDYNAKAKLTFRDAAHRGAAIEVPVAASPLILNHHLSPSESVHMMDVGSNSAMVSGYEKVLGNAFEAFSGDRYEGDVWLQDEIEFATLTGMNGARIDVVIDSIRNRGLDPITEDQWTGQNGRKANWIRGIWGSGTAESGDSFGNLEVSPPVTVDGVEYPFGRIYFGNLEHGKLNDELAGFLEEQEIQKPFTIDTSWLCVGHVDEFISFIPDTSAPKGFRMLYADTRVGYEWVSSFDSNINLSLYSQAHGVSTMGELASDSSIKSINERLQTDVLDPILDKLKEELALDDEDILLFPSIFEESSGCRGNGNMVALIPGTVNLIVAWKDQDTAQLFMPDPFLRASSSSQSDDPFIAAARKLLPSTVETYFLDDWQDYHQGRGEVHCGSNVVRTPSGPWWKQTHHVVTRTNTKGDAR
jgi:protein-arginine deiminase